MSLVCAKVACRRPHQPETHLSMTSACPSAVVRSKMARSHLGLKHSKETRLKMSQAQRLRWERKRQEAVSQQTRDAESRSGQVCPPVPFKSPAPGGVLRPERTSVFRPGRTLAIIMLLNFIDDGSAP